MKTFQDILGWYDAEDLYAAVVRDLPGGRLVEIGSYLGRSVCHLGRLAKDSGKPFSITAVDRCTGSGPELGTDHHADAVARGGGNFAGELYQNLLDCGVADTVSLLVCDSVRAAAYFADASIDFVYLDGGHTREQVAADIAAWWPKIKPGGVLAGDDWVPGLWDGVIRAVTDAFGDRVSRVSCDSWCVRREGE